VKEMNISKKIRKKHYRPWYELLCESPRIHAKEASLSLEIDQRTASARLKQSREEHYIVGPEVRKMSYSNSPEYMYFVDCDDPDLLYQKFCEDKNIILHALMYGFANMWVISKEKMDIKGDIIVGGPRSDYYVAYAPNHSWDDAIQTIRKKIDVFDPKKYIPREYIKTHFDETIEWSEKDEILYRYFKYDLRRPFAPVMDKYKICTYTVYNWLERLPVCCTIATSYFPEKLSEYEPYLFLFETDYEDFIIELFSELPSSSWFFKVSDKLFLYTRISKKFIKKIDLRVAPNRLNIPLLGNELLERGIIRRKARGPLEAYWVKDV
jgi:hypothetical protein